MSKASNTFCLIRSGAAASRSPSIGSRSSRAGSPPVWWVACLARAASLRPMSSRSVSNSPNRLRCQVRRALTAGAFGEGLDFADVGVFGGVDPLEPLAELGGLLLAAGGVLGGAGGQLLGEEGLAVGAEDAGGEEPAYLLGEHVFADRHGGRVARGLGPGGGGCGS